MDFDTLCELADNLSLVGHDIRRSSFRQTCDISRSSFSQTCDISRSSFSVGHDNTCNLCVDVMRET